MLTFDGIHTVICMLDPKNICSISNDTSGHLSSSNPYPIFGIPNLVKPSSFILVRSEKRAISNDFIVGLPLLFFFVIK